MEVIRRRVIKFCTYMTLLLIVVFITTVKCGQKAEAAEVEKRLWGNNRYRTAVAISQSGWSNSEYVVLAAGEGNDKFADALAGSTLAYILDAPVLLTPQNGLDGDTLSEIRRLKTEKVFLLGGPGVISEKVEGELKKMNIEVERIWGEDRYDTAGEIARRVREYNVFNRAILTTGMEFQYAIMAAPFGAVDRVPILFTEKGALTKTTQEAIEHLKVDRIDIIGGTSVISRRVERTLEDIGIEVKRIGGADIYETNINVINEYNPNPSKIAVARDNLFADSLAGVPFAAQKAMAILLVDKVYVDEGTRQYINKLEPEEMFIFGGEGAVSKDAISMIKNEPVDIFGRGNIVNGGLAAMKDGYVYYINDSDGYKLYRESVDGSIKEKVSDDSAGYINVQDDWVYYVNFNDDNKVYKIKTDGSERHKLNDESSGYLKLEGDFLYYTNDGDSNRIYRMKTDGSARARLNSDISFSLNVVDGFIYYVNFSDNNKIYRIKADGTGRTRINGDSSWCLVVSDNWVYFSNSSEDDRIYKIKVDGSGRVPVSQDPVLDLNVVGGWIYYGNLRDGERLYKVKTDGSGRARVNDEGSYAINIAGDWIYYSNFEEVLSLYKIRLNGEGRTKVE